MKNWMNMRVLLPLLGGAVVGIALFLLGDAQDAPGLSLMGLVAAFLLMTWGVSRAGVLKKGLFAPILWLGFGAGGIVFSLVLWLDGEFAQSPGAAWLGIVPGIAFLAVGVWRLRKARL